MKKWIVISAAFVLAVVALYESIYFERLDAKNAKEMIRKVSPKETAEYFWKNELDGILETAIDLKSFDSVLAANPRALVQRYGKAVGITSNYCFLVKGTATRIVREAERIPAVITNGHANYQLVARHIYGNTARDATGYFDIDDFRNTMDFNTLATELNAIIVKEVAGRALNAISPGASMHFIGAVEINADNIPTEIAIVPLKLEAVR